MHAYPRWFRNQYGTEIARTLRDMHRYGGMSKSRLMISMARDVALTAPRLRMEALVTHTKILAVVALTALAALVAIAGATRFVLLIVVLVGLFAVLVHRHDRPITNAVRSKHWWRWGIGGLAILATLIIAEGAGPDFDWLPGVWYLLWFLALMGLAVLAVGVVFRWRKRGLLERSHRGPRPGLHLRDVIQAKLLEEKAVRYFRPRRPAVQPEQRKEDRRNQDRDQPAGRGHARGGLGRLLV